MVPGWHVIQCMPILYPDSMLKCLTANKVRCLEGGPQGSSTGCLGPIQDSALRRNIQQPLSIVEGAMGSVPDWRRCLLARQQVHACLAEGEGAAGQPAHSGGSCRGASSRTVRRVPSDDVCIPARLMPVIWIHGHMERNNPV